MNKITSRQNKFIATASFSILVLICCLSACKVSYSFRDVSIDYTKIKTIRINLIENRARYVNPQLAPKLTDKLQQKLTAQTKLIRTNSDDASLILNGFITDESVSTAAISSTQASTNRLTVSVHIIKKNTVVPKDSEEFDISRNFDFSATLSFEQAESQLLDEIIRSLTDDIFNKMFSKW